MPSKIRSATVSADATGRGRPGAHKHEGEHGSSRRLSSFIPNSCQGVKPGFHKAGRRNRMNATNPTVVIGIDVAKDTLEVATSTGEHWPCLLYTSPSPRDS